IGAIGATTIVARAATLTTTGRPGWRLAQATTSDTAATPARNAVTIVVDTVNAAPGMDEANQAIQSNAKSNGWTASAKNRATPVRGLTTSARKSTGWASVITGAATRLESGAIRLIRPKTHATSGAVMAHAMSDVIRSLAILPRQPSSRAARCRFQRDPAATRAHMPSTLS